jgi:DNA-binding transcriptional regulator YdaS (Cro superfamily)
MLPMEPTPLDRAIAAADGQTRLAEMLSTPKKRVLSQHITNWKARGVPADRCIAIEIAVGGAVTRYDLRPDVFGDAPPPAEAAA